MKYMQSIAIKVDEKYSTESAPVYSTGDQHHLGQLLGNRVASVGGATSSIDFNRCISIDNHRIKYKNIAKSAYCMALTGVNQLQ